VLVWDGEQQSEGGHVGDCAVAFWSREAVSSHRAVSRHTTAHSPTAR
jgi:hypothetical protein